MARQLQALVISLTLEPKDYRLRGGETVGDCPRSSSDAVAWEITSSTNLRGSTASRGATWSGVQEDRWKARARLARGLTGFTTDLAFDTATNGPRTARTPTLEAAGVRAWLALELAYLEPEADTSCLFRIYDGETGDELAWDGAEWAAQATGDDDPTTWNTGQVLQDRFPELSGNVRKLAILAWLRTDTSEASPEFYGARVAYGVRQVAPLDDALFRTLLASLRAELRATGIMEWTTAAETDAVELVASGADVGPDPFAYQVTGVDAAFDLTADPDELAELPGSYAAGTWTPTAPLEADHLIRLDFRYVPDLVVRRHRDALELARLPAIYLAASGAPVQVLHPQGTILVRDTNADPPTAQELPEPEIVTVPLELRVVAELGADVERLAQALTAWLCTLPDGSALGLGHRRELVSPETGQVIAVQSAARAVETAAALAQGVAEARASWLLTFPRATAHTTTTAPLVSETGATFTLETLP